MQQWLERLEELKQFQSEYHHYQVTQKYMGRDYRTLNCWICRQRGEYKKFKRGEACMLDDDDERVAMLEGLGEGWLDRAGRGQKEATKLGFPN